MKCYPNTKVWGGDDIQNRYILGLALWATEVDSKCVETLQFELTITDLLFSFWRNHIFCMSGVVNQFLKWLSEMTHFVINLMRHHSPDLVRVSVTADLKIGRVPCWALSNNRCPEKPRTFLVWWQKSERFKRWEGLGILLAD